MFTALVIFILLTYLHEADDSEIWRDCDWPDNARAYDGSYDEFFWKHERETKRIWFVADVVTLISMKVYKDDGGILHFQCVIDKHRCCPSKGKPENCTDVLQWLPYREDSRILHYSFPAFKSYAYTTRIEYTAPYGRIVQIDGENYTGSLLIGCPEIGFRGHWSKPPKFAEIISTPETHSITYGMFETSVLSVEGSTVQEANISTWQPRFTVVKLIQYCYDSTRTNITWSIAGESAKHHWQGNLNDFTDKMRFHPFKRNLLRISRFMFSWCDGAVAAVLIASRRENTVLNPVHKFMNEILVQKNKHAKLHWESDILPALRLFQVRTVVDFILLEGSHKLFTPCVSSGLPSSGTHCYVRTNRRETYQRKARLKIDGRNTKFWLFNLQITDTGYYKCVLADNIVSFDDYYIVVLPRPSDVKLYLQNEKFNPQSTNLDERFIPYIGISSLYHVEPCEEVYVTCAYNLSIGLDNYDGLEFRCRLTGANAPLECENVVSTLLHFGLMSIHVRQYALPLIKDNTYQIGLSCMHTYKPSSTLPTDAGRVASSHLKIAANRKIRILSERKPIIVKNLIFHSVVTIEQSLRDDRSGDPNLPAYAVDDQNRWIREGYYSGQYKAVHLPTKYFATAMQVIRVDEDYEVVRCDIHTRRLPNDTFTVTDNRAVGQVASHVDYSCFMGSNSIALIISIHNLNDCKLTESVTLKHFSDSIVKFIKHKWGDASGDNSSLGITNLNGTDSDFRIVRLFVRRRTTFIERERAKILIGPGNSTRCTKKLLESGNAEDIASHVRVVHNKEYTEISFASVSLDDTGLYECDCATCRSPWRLVILPSNESVRTEFDFQPKTEVLAKPPTLLGGQLFNVTCGVLLSAETEANYTFSLKGNCENALPEFERILSSTDGVWKFEKNTTLAFSSMVFSIKAPQSVRCGDQLLFECHINLTDIQVDPMELENSRRRQFVRGVGAVKISLWMFPQLLTHHTKYTYHTTEFKYSEPHQTSYTMEHHQNVVVHNATRNVSKMLFDAAFQPMSDRDGVKELNFVAFLGIPVGDAGIYYAYHYRGKVRVERCPSIQWTRLGGSQYNLANNPLFAESGGRSFYIYKCTRMLLPEHIGIATALFNTYDENIYTIPKQIDEFQDVLGKWFSHYVNGTAPSLDPEKELSSRQFSAIPEYWILKIRLTWVHVNVYREIVELHGRSINSHGENVKCTFRYSENDTHGTLDRWFSGTKNPVTDSHAFRKVKWRSQMHDTGIYECNDPKCPNPEQDLCGMPPRYLYVIPRQYELGMHLKATPLKMNETITHIPVTEAKPYMAFIGQNVSVRCTYLTPKPPSLTHYANPTVNLTVMLEVAEDGETYYQEVPYTVGVKYIINPQDYDVFSVASFTFSTPDDTQSKSLSVSCNFHYDGLLHRKFDPKYANDYPRFTRTLPVEIDVIRSPVIFYNYTTSIRKELIDYLSSSESISPVEFHRTGTRKRLLESQVTIRTIHYLGTPEGTHAIWLVYESDGALRVEECLTIRYGYLQPATIPVPLRQHTSFRKYHGKGYARSTFVCSLKPDHVAMVIITYQDLGTNLWDSPLLTILKNEIISTTEFYLKHPSSHTKKALKRPDGVNLDYRIQKVVIGWHASIKPDEPIVISAVSEYFHKRHTEGKTFTYVLYHKKTLNSSEQVAFFENRTELPYERVTIRPPISYEQAGYYRLDLKVCGSSSSTTCTVYKVARPRRLVVLPKEDVIEILFRKDRLPKTQYNNINDHYDEKNSSSGGPILRFQESIYIYCRVQSPLFIDGLEHVTFELLDTPRDEQKRGPLNLTYTLVDKTKVNNLTVLVAKYTISSLNTIQGPLQARCHFTYSSQLFEEKDMRMHKIARTLVKTRSIHTSMRMDPNIYERHTSSNSSRELQVILQTRMLAADSARSYHESHTGGRLPEKLVHICSLVYLGYPRGIAAPRLFYEDRGRLGEEECTNVIIRDVDEPAIPEDVRRLSSYGGTLGVGFVNISFDCVLRTEHVAFLVVALNSHAPRKSMSEYESDSIKELRTTVERWINTTQDTTKEKPSFAPEIIVSYRMVKLSIGWVASVPIGSTVTMLGRGGQTDNVKCFYWATTNSDPRPISSHWGVVPVGENVQAFYLSTPNVRYHESGYYGCNLTNYPRPKVAILRRRLLVLPDSSVLYIAITHELLGIDDPWESNYTIRASDERPVLLSDTAAYTHCVYQTPTGMHTRPALSFNYEKMSAVAANKSLPHQEEAVRTNTTHALHPYIIRAPSSLEYVGSAKVTCTLQYHFEEPIPGNLKESIEPTTFSEVKVLQIVGSIRPEILAEYTRSTDRRLQTEFRKSAGKTEDPDDFGQNTTDIQHMQENVTGLRLRVVLGQPKGNIVVWTLFEHDGSLVEEPCRKGKWTSLRNSPNPKQTGSPYGLMHKVVHALFYCVLRPEHVAVAAVVYNGYQTVLDNEKTAPTLRKQVSSIIKASLDQTSSEKEMTLNTQPGLYAAYRWVRANVSWKSTVSIGTYVKMLGFNTYSEKIHFNLISPRVTYADSGIYSCAVDQVACEKCVSQFGFSPRKLYVLPDASLIQMNLNHHLSTSAETAKKDNFTQLDPDNTPFVLCKQDLFVSCTHPDAQGVTEEPKASFKFHMYERQGNTNHSLPFEEVSRFRENISRVILITTVYRIRAPKSVEVLGPLFVTCQLNFTQSPSTTDYNVSSSDQSFAREKMIRVEIRHNTVVFTKYTRVSRPILQQAFREQMNNSVTSAQEFFAEKTAVWQLEGLVSVKYIASLGTPRGRSNIFLFYRYRDQIFNSPCRIQSIDNLTKEDTPLDILLSHEYRETKGMNFARIHTICPLLIQHFAMLLFTGTVFDAKVSALRIQDNFIKAVEGSLKSWHTDSNDRNETLRLDTFGALTSIQFQLFPLNIRWRASVVLGWPIVLFGTLPHSNETLPNCRYAVEADRNTETQLEKIGFKIYVNRTTASYEVIKLKAKVTDAGFYHCELTNCKACGTAEHAQTSQRRLIILPKIFSITLRFSYFVPDDYNKLEKHNHGDYRETISAIYPRQRISVQCMYEMSKVKYAETDYRFSYMFHSDHDSVPITKPTREIGSSHLRGSVSDTQLDAYEVVGAEVHSPGDYVTVTCSANFSEVTSHEDINAMNHFVSQSSSSRMDARDLIEPRINTESIQTNKPEVTVLFSNPLTSNPDKEFFRSNVNAQRFEEGFLDVDYQVDLGSPLGWTGIWTVYNGSVTHSMQACTAKMNASSVPANSTWNQSSFECFLQPEHQAIVVYAMNSVDPITNRTDLEQTFADSIVQVVRSWLSVGSTTDNESKPKFDTRTSGTYRLVRIRVGWKASVRIGEKVVMLGRRDRFGQAKVRCYFGKHSEAQPLNTGFVVNITEDEEYFQLGKSSAELSDSGLYSCELDDCSECADHLGFRERRLLVLPDSSVLTLTYRIPMKLADWVHPNCPVSDNTIVQPRQNLPFACVYLTAKDTLHQARLSVTHLSRSILTQIESVSPIEYMNTIRVDKNTTWLVNHTFDIEAPSVTTDELQSRVVCEIRLNEVSVPHDLTESRSAYSINQSLDFLVLNPAKPKINRESLKTQHEHLTTSLVSHLQLRTNKETFLRADDLPPLIEEGPLVVDFSVKLGHPFGWSMIWLIYQQNDSLYKDPCPLVLENRNLQGEAEHVRATCLLQLNHVALLVGVANIPGTNLTRSKMTKQVEQMVLCNVSMWLDLECSVEYPDPICFDVDYSLVRVRPGWRGVINEGEEAVLRGRLARRPVEELVCFYRETLDAEVSPVLDTLKITTDEDADMFVISFPQTREVDTGYYECRLLNDTPGVPSAGLSAHHLRIRPGRSATKCAMSVERDGRDIAGEQQRMSDGTIYVLSNQVGRIHCFHSRMSQRHYPTTYSFMYDMHDESENQWHSLPSSDNAILLKHEENDTIETFLYQFIGIQAREYTGLLRANCVSEFIVAGESQDLTMFGPVVRIECTHKFTIQQGAIGLLWIKSVFKDFDSQPVPICSKFECSGGFGRPALHYQWTLLRSTSYVGGLSGPDYPSLLPTQPGGWGVPTKLLTKVPTRELTIDGATLLVPTDPAYRGMSYMYLCTGENTVAGTKHMINRTVILHISACLTNRVELDLTILLSSRLMSSCVISGSPDPQIQFYGYYFLPLMRQLILALPYGDDRVRFNLLIEDNKTANTYPSSLPFAHNLSRTELLQYLYSSHVKPITVESNCRGPLLSLDRLINELYAFKPRNITNRPHLALLTFDNQVDTSLSNSSLRKLHQLMQPNFRRLLAFAHSSKQAKLLTRNIISLFNPDNVTFLLPHLSVETTCETCRIAFDDPQLRMRREELFEVVCSAGGSRIPDPIPSPVFSFSIAPEYWIRGLLLSVSCTTDYVPSELEGDISVLTICLSGAPQISMLGKKRPTLQRLDDACLQSVASKTDVVSPSSHNTSFSVSSLMKLNETMEGKKLLCFRRIGDYRPEILDAISYTVSNITVLEPPVETPALKPVVWPKLENRAAQLNCIFAGFEPNLEILLIMKHFKLSNQTKIPILARTNVHPKRPNLLTWYEIPRRLEGFQLFCIVRQKNYTEGVERWLYELPQATDQLRISPPTRFHNLNADCPVAPEINTKPKLDSMSLSKGDRVELNCTAPTTSKDTPLKLVYTTPYLTNIVCNQGCATGKRASIPCVFVSTEDKDCSQLETTSLDSRFYSVSCSSVLNSATGQHYLVIHLVIVQLRMEDINAHMFCETIPLQAEGIEVTQRRASIVKRLMFTLTPSIQDFVYDAKSFTWKCVALSIPPVQTGYIRFVSSTNTLMSYRMKSYSSVSTQSHPELPFSHLVPGFEAETNESMDFQSTITFVPKRSSLKTLPEGEVWMECRFAHLSRSLKTRIGTYDRLHDVPDPIHKTGGTYSHICVIPIQKNQTMKLVCLHRVIRYSWFDYDTTLLTVSVLNQTNVLSNPIATYIREKKLSGLWTVGHWPQVQVDLGEERMELLLVVEVLNNTEFDSGEYYCSFITTHRQQLHREVTSVLFRGKQKKAIFGQRYPLKNSLWFRVDVPADVGELIHSRCIAWTTNPENRELIRFGLSSGQQKQLPNETIRSFAEQPTMVTHMAEQYYTVAFDDQALARQCYAADQYMDLSKRLPVPSITCVVPDLYWEPVGLSNYERTMNLTCRTTSGCANAVFRWNWVAGPIPQLPSAATEGNRLGVIKGPTLYLASLSRSGAYVFRCTVTCACVSTTQSNSILVSFFMHVREVDDRGPGEDVPPDLIDTKPSEDDLARSLEREYWEKYSKEDVAHDGVDKAEQARIRRDEARSHELTRSAGPPEVGFLPPSLIPDELQQMKPSHVTDELDVLRSSASGYTELRDQLFSDIVRKFTESDFSGILTPPLVSRLVGDLPDAQQEREKYRQAARRWAYEQVPELHQYQQPYPISSPGAFETPTRSLYESELSKAKDELKLRRQDYSHMAKPYEAVLSDGLDVHLSIQHPTERDRTLIGPVDELPTGRRSPLECFEFTGDTEIGLLDLPTRAIYTRAIQRYEVPKMATTRLTSRAETRGVRVVDSLTPIYRDVPRQSDREPFRKARQVGLNADSGLRIPEALASKTDDMQSKISSYAKASEDRDYSGVYTHQQPGSVSEMPISTLDQPVSREYGIRSTRDRLGVTFRGGDYVRLDDRARGKRPSRMASETAKPHLIGDFEGQRAVKRFIELLRRDAYRRGGVMLSAHMPSPATEISDTELEFLVQTSMVGRDNIEFGEQVQHSGDYERLDMGYPEQLRRYGSRQVVPVSPTQEFSRHPEDETLGLFAKLKERLDSVLSYISSPESHASKPQRHTRYSSPDEQPQTYNLDDVIMSETTAKLVQIRKAFKPSRTPTMGEWGKAGGAEIRGRRKTTSTDDSKIATVEQHANRYGYDAFDRESPFIDQIHFSAQRMIDVTDEFTATTLTTPELVSDRAVGKPISKSLQIIPNIIRLPAQVTILCPMAPYNPRRGFTPTAISWSHATSTANFYRDKSERILYCPFATREHHVSIRYREPQRVFAYPPERWIDAYSLDIKPIRPDDYGYYACTFLMDIGRTGMVRTNFTKLAPYPLCIIPQEPSDASIVVKLSASQSKSTVDGEEDQCWAPNVAVMIRCETQAYQLFCEDADRTTDGYRLIRTVISASLITTTFAGHQSSIPLTADDEVPFAEPLEIGPVVSKTWTFPMQPEHHMTYVRCSCRPELIKPSLPPITYWEWLKNEFYQTHAPVMVRNSDAIKLCIKPAPVGIQVRPNPKSVSSDGDPMQLDLPPEAYIECVRHGDNGTTPDMHVYVSDRFNRTRHSNSGEDIHWNVSDGLRLNWPVQRQGHVARLRIPLTVNPGETYHIHCFTELTGPNHTFILKIWPPASIEQSLLPIWQTVTLFVILTVLPLMACTYQWMMTIEGTEIHNVVKN